MKKKCPQCNSSRVIITEEGLTCKKCGFENNKNKQAQMIKYDRQFN